MREYRYEKVNSFSFKTHLLRNIFRFWTMCCIRDNCDAFDLIFIRIKSKLLRFRHWRCKGRNLFPLKIQYRQKVSLLRQGCQKSDALRAHKPFANIDRRDSTQSKKVGKDSATQYFSSCRGSVCQREAFVRLKQRELYQAQSNESRGFNSRDLSSSDTSSCSNICSTLQSRLLCRHGARQPPLRAFLRELTNCGFLPRLSVPFPGHDAYSELIAAFIASSRSNWRNCQKKFKSIYDDDNAGANVPFPWRRCYTVR